MRTMNPKIAIPLALILALVAFGINHYLLSPVPVQNGRGVVKNLEFYEEGVMERTTTHTGRNAGGGSSTTHIRIPSRFVYTIALANGREVRYSENAHSPESSHEFEIGEEVEAKYSVREIPFMEDKVLVEEIHKVGS